MRRLQDPETFSEQRPVWRALLKAFTAQRSSLLNISNPVGLKAAVINLINELFKDRQIGKISFERQNAYSALSLTAAREGRAIYIPEKGSETIFVTSPPQQDLMNIEEFTAAQLMIDTSSLPQGAESIMAIPLVAGSRQKPVCHGVMLAYLTRPQTAGESLQRANIDLRIMRMIGEAMAIALS